MTRPGWLTDVSVSSPGCGLVLDGSERHGSGTFLALTSEVTMLESAPAPDLSSNSDCSSRALQRWQPGQMFLTVGNAVGCLQQQASSRARAEDGRTQLAGRVSRLEAQIADALSLLATPALRAIRQSPMARGGRGSLGAVGRAFGETQP